MNQPHTKEHYKDVIDSFNAALYAVDTVKEVLWCVVDQVISKLNYQDCVIYLYNERSRHLVQAAAYGPKNVENRKIKDPITIEPGEGIVGRVFEYGIGRIVNDTSLDPNYIIDDRFRLSEIAIPIKFEGKTLGVIDSEHPKENFFTSQDQELLTKIAEIIGARISAIRQQNQ